MHRYLGMFTYLGSRTRSYYWGSRTRTRLLLWKVTRYRSVVSGERWPGCSSNTEYSRNIVCYRGKHVTIKGMCLSLILGLSDTHLTCDQFLVCPVFGFGNQCLNFQILFLGFSMFIIERIPAASDISSTVRSSLINFLFTGVVPSR